MKVKLVSSNLKQLQPQEKAYEAVDTEIKGFLVRVQPTGRQTAYFSYRTMSGKRSRIKIGVIGSELTIAQARDEAKAYAGKVAAGADVQGEKATAKKHAKHLQKNTLYLFMKESYKPWALANLKSGHLTIKSIRASFKHLLPLPLVDITVREIEHWRVAELNRGIKPSTINRLVSALSAVLTKAHLWEVIPEHPLRKVKPLKLDEAKRARFLSEEENAALLQVLDNRDQELKEARASANEHRRRRGYEQYQDLSDFAYADRMTPMIMLSLKTGMRKGEVFDLHWEAIDFENKVVTVHGEFAKSAKTRHIPLSPSAIQALENWTRQAYPDNERVFPSDTGGRLDNVNTAWRNILKAANIEEFRWHDMRHDFASQLVMKGVPLNTVRELCGHSDLNTTLRYAHLAPDHKADAVALIE